jgi:hypothetical protein
MALVSYNVAEANWRSVNMGIVDSHHSRRAGLSLRLLQPANSSSREILNPVSHKYELPVRLTEICMHKTANTFCRFNHLPRENRCIPIVSKYCSRMYHKESPRYKSKSYALWRHEVLRFGGSSPWKLGQQGLPKRWYPTTSLHSVKTQKISYLHRRDNLIPREVGNKHEAPVYADDMQKLRQR